MSSVLASRLRKSALGLHRHFASKHYTTQVGHQASRQDGPWTFARGIAFGTGAVLSATVLVAGVCYASVETGFPIPFPMHPDMRLPPDSPESIAYTDKLENELQNLHYVRQLREQPDAKDWYETRPYSRYPVERKGGSLTAGSLSGPGKLALGPLVRAKWDESESVVIMHVGRALCGHDGVIHGGLIATVLDETMGRTALLNMPTKLGVTANLNLNYRNPTLADQFIVIKTKVEEVKGRKVVVSARLENLKGKLLADATAIFVEPRYATLLSNNSVKQLLAVPDKPPILGDGEAMVQGKESTS